MAKDCEEGHGAGSTAEVFVVFLKLGLSSFGGPIAHLGYFRDELVTRRKWIGEAGFADLVALCQFLPGPASSQVGFSLGVLRGRGLLGGLAAWTGFTLPSAVLLVLFATGANAMTGPVWAGVLHGLKLVAVAVVAQAVRGMAHTLAPDGKRAALALASLALVVVVGGTPGQLSAIALGAVAGLLLCRGEARLAATHPDFPVGRRAGVAALALFLALLVLPPFLAKGGARFADFFDAYYRSGALVFGGGHVVLPLLRNAVVDPGWMTAETFLAGYGAAQAVPGPLFSFAAYLGAASNLPPNGVAGATMALVALFLPGILLVYGMLPFWDRLRNLPWAQAAMRGANAAVVGLLAAALYDPVWTNAVFTSSDFALAAAGFLLLVVWKLPPWIVVALLALSGALGGVLG